MSLLLRIASQEKNITLKDGRTDLWGRGGSERALGDGSLRRKRLSIVEERSAVAARGKILVSLGK